MSRWVINTHLLHIFFPLLLLIPANSHAEAPSTRIESDLLEYSAGIYTARGNVVITQDKRRLTSSTVILNNNTGEVMAHGNVEFIEGGNVLTSDSLMYNMRTNYIRIDEGKVFIKEDNYHIKGDAIERLAENRFRIKRASFTTCDGKPPCWRFKGRNINIHLNHVLTAQGVSLAIRDVPVLYLPFIALPILQERQTGFLIPRIGYNTGEGLKMNNAFFWAISDSQDATIYADYYGKKGWGSGLEYRYVLSQNTRGRFNGYFIRDIQVDRDRWNIKYEHSQILAKDLSAKMRINYLNDKSLYKDISEDIGERLQRTQDSDLYVNRRWDTLSAHLWAQYTQNLSDKAGGSEGIFQRLPEAGFKVMERKISRLPLYWDLASSASRWEETDTGLTRLHLTPRISARLFEEKGLTFIPAVSAEHTSYYIDGDTDPVHTNLYSLSASLSSKFYRSSNIGGYYIEHFVEPTIRYEYAEGSVASSQPLSLRGGEAPEAIPFLDPNPAFPTFTKEGKRWETIKEKNIISFMLLNRIISLSKGSRYEPFYLRLTQMYMVDSPDLPSTEHGFSDLRLEAILRFSEMISIDMDSTYSYKDENIKFAGTDLEFRGDKIHLTMGQRYSEDPSLNFLTASVRLNLSKDVNTSIDTWYDNKDHLMREANYSVRYLSQCWGVTVAYRYKPEEEQFSILLTLKGVGSVGGG